MQTLYTNINNISDINVDGARGKSGYGVIMYVYEN